MHLERDLLPLHWGISVPHVPIEVSACLSVGRKLLLKICTQRTTDIATIWVTRQTGYELYLFARAG